MTRPIRRMTVLLSLAAMVIAVAAAQPAAAAGGQTPYPGCPRMITNADDGTTITLVRGECATLSLDTQEVWKTPQSSSAAVRVFDIPTFVPDQMWALAADHDGSATITTTGVPDCDPGEVCPMYIRLFTVHIDVVAPYGA
jgi:hypothetical protein